MYWTKKLTLVCNKFSENSPYLRAIESMNFLALLVAVGVFCSVCSGSSVSLLGFRTYRETFSSEGFRPSSRINRFRSSPLTSPEPINVIKKKNTNCVLWTNSNFQYRAVANPISTRGADYAHHSTTSPPDFQTLRRPCNRINENIRIKYH